MDTAEGQSSAIADKCQVSHKPNDSPAPRLPDLYPSKLATALAASNEDATILDCDMTDLASLNYGARSKEAQDDEINGGMDS